MVGRIEKFLGIGGSVLFGVLIVVSYLVCVGFMMVGVVGLNGLLKI